ncbi:uncharacterized protein B0H18DRAFT_1128213 [Fomitopsis serialis]|uniref:uncharacterized protein n=1 Tax=Fomitopsis serialis TaxID=139415 RepID=UPI0020074CC7|nr:uncharacterized protein B0H18DRAFT_1128213 [Neoantrodia serialis]KAH9911709.1 hypothetical protein B0H18DRAFT_1128213 [Neoantrodia serialis]
MYGRSSSARSSLTRCLRVADFMANKPMPEDTLPVSAASDDDRAHLRGRSRQEAQHRVSVEGQALQRRSLDLGFLHNSTITLNMLPNEIFVSIIRHAVSGEDTMAWITRTMGVCRHWRETIIRTPLLWTDIRLSGNMQFSALCLTRSSGATINWYVSEAHVRPPPLDWYSATGSLLALHHTRIKHMRIYLEATITPLVQLYWQLSTIALPVLVSMDLTAVAGLSTQWIPSYLPSLRRLSLHRLSVDVTHLPLSQLTSLDLNNVDLPSRSLASLLDVLKACTSLQRFVYEDTDDMPINELPVAADNRVSLPHIRHFCITATSAHTSSLLVHILLAKQTRVVLYPNDFHPPQDENHIPVLNTFLPRDSAYWPAMKDLTHIMVWWYARDGLTIYADHETTEFWELRPWRSLDYVNLGTDTDELSPVPALVIEHLQIDWPYPSCTAEPLRAVVEELGDFFPVSAKTFVLRGYAEEIPTETWTEP